MRASQALPTCRMCLGRLLGRCSDLLLLGASHGGAWLAARVHSQGHA